MRYTTILHEARLALGITMNEYCIADCIYHLSSNPKNPMGGWCFASKQAIGDSIGATKQWVITCLNSLVDKGIVEKSDNGRLLRTTEKWYKTVIEFEKTDLTDGKESLPSSVNKVDRSGKESLPPSYNKIYTEKNNTSSSSSTEEEPQSLFPSEDTKSQKKESKKKEKVTSVHRELQDIWLNEIHPGWAHRGGIDARAIKNMIGNMTKYSKSIYGEQYDPPEEYLKRFFRHFCNSLPEFYKNATIDVLDRKFNSIIDEIKQGTSKQQTGKQRPGSVSSIQEWINSLPTTAGV